VTVGLAAIVFQYFLLLAAAIVFFMLVGLVLSALGIDLPTP
jgi:hydrogenase/urease accessory protein HupE